MPSQFHQAPKGKQFVEDRVAGLIKRDRLPIGIVSIIDYQLDGNVDPSYLVLVVPEKTLSWDDTYKHVLAINTRLKELGVPAYVQANRNSKDALPTIAETCDMISSCWNKISKIETNSEEYWKYPLVDVTVTPVGSKELCYLVVLEAPLEQYEGSFLFGDKIRFFVDQAKHQIKQALLYEFDLKFKAKIDVMFTPDRMALERTHDYRALDRY